MVQSLNTKAIYTFATMVLRRPNLMIPHVSVTTISDIDFVALKEYTNIRAIIFDKDHTLTTPYVNHIHPHTQYGLQSCMDAFGRSNVAILSNSAGTLDDIDDQDAIQIETSMGISVIRHTTKKPGGIEEVLSHFTPHVTHPSQLCMIGDRILTDIVFGNLYNMFTIHTAALTNISPTAPVFTTSSSSQNLPSSSLVTHKKDNWTAQLLRPMEIKILYRSNEFGKKRRYFTNPIPHPAYDHILTNRHTFVLSTSTTTDKTTTEK